MQIQLKPIGMEHAEAMCRWMLDAEVAENLGLRREPSLKRTREWIQRVTLDQSCRAFAIERESRHLGNVVLDERDERLRSARMSVYVGERDERGRGIGQAAIELALAHGFGEMDLNKIWLIVHAENEPAFGLYRKIGFQVEGRLRDGFFLRGRLIEALLMGLLKRDYEISRIKSSVTESQ
ncbi:MAG: GNAT family N-acetyltransferase [Verrucomicrobiaceae bacterium]